jgi:hypothetical protein
MTRTKGSRIDGPPAAGEERRVDGEDGEGIRPADRSFDDQRRIRPQAIQIVLTERLVQE